MNKDKDKKSMPDWYELWIQQSKVFFDSTQDQLQDLFKKGAMQQPEKYLEQMNEWLQTVKSKWKQMQDTQEEKQFQTYWNMMYKMYNESAALLGKKWLERSKEGNPITNMQALYELWLECCQETYRNHYFQEAVSEMMNAAKKFWQVNSPK